jgi:hypothetical protein
MNLSKLRDWLEVTGLFAVVLSLVFVGIEVKQSREIAVAGQYQARTELLMDMHMHRAEMPQARRVIGEWARDAFLEAAKSMPNSEEVSEMIAGMTDDQLGLERQEIYLTLRLLDNNHFQHQRGYFDDESWQMSLNVINEMAQSDIVTAGWPSMRHEFRTSFREIFESRQAAQRSADAR